MSQIIEVKVPDIGDFKNVPVIEVLVKVGDTVQAEDPIITLESDKATMEIPSPVAGTVKEVILKVGDSVSEGSVVLRLENTEVTTPAPAKTAAIEPPQPSSDKSREPSATTEIRVPDIGDFKDIPIIEVLVKPGDALRIDDPIITLESDKATMEIPSSASGIVKDVKVKVGDHVSQGAVILVLETSSAVVGTSQAVAPAGTLPSSPAPEKSGTPTQSTGDIPPPVMNTPPPPVYMPPPGELAAEAVGGHKAHASPSVRRFARELGVDVAKLSGTGPKGRILHQDVQAYVKAAMTQLASGTAPAANTGAITGGGSLDLLPWPKVDFAKFGAIETKPLLRIKKISGANLARNWVMIPHVTQFDEADITDIEQFRVQINKENEKSGIKITMLAFLIKASVAALKKYPEFNSSLDGDNLVLKQYCHIGFAADTPNGLVVPVIRDADKKSVFDIARETSELAKKGRDGKLSPTDMQGGCFSISSLGGIGGTAFTPIINAPEVAILGVSKSETKPKWNGQEFVPKLMLPLSLSYDHRVIDGASAARFTSYLAQLLADMRRVIL